MKTRIMMMTAVLALFFGFANGANDPEDYEYVPVVRETVGWIYDWQTKPPMKMGKYFLPFSISSALPMIPCSGVLSSCETFAVNSRRLRSAR